MVFGVPQTINSAGYLINAAIGEVMKLGSFGCVQAVQGQPHLMHRGQLSLPTDAIVSRGVAKPVHRAEP